MWGEVGLGMDVWKIKLEWCFFPYCMTLLNNALEEYAQYEEYSIYGGLVIKSTNTKISFLSYIPYISCPVTEGDDSKGGVPGVGGAGLWGYARPY